MGRGVRNQSLIQSKDPWYLGDYFYSICRNQSSLFVMYGSIHWVKSTKSCVPHPIPYITILSSLKVLCPFSFLSVNALPTKWNIWQSTTCFLFAFLRMVYEWNHSILPFGLGYYHLVKCIPGSPMQLCKSVVFLWPKSILLLGYGSLFSHFLVEEHFGCFQILGIINKVTIKICIQNLVWT